MNYNEQNQLVKIKKLLKDNKVEQGIRLADQLINQHYKIKELNALIKKILIRKKILSNNPNISKLENLINQKNFASAKYFFKHHSSALSKSSKSLFLVGKIFLELNEMDEAQKYLEEAIKIDSKNLNIRKEISIFYMTIGKIEKAIENFNYIKKTNPTDGENHRLLSRTKKYYSNDDIHIKEMEHLILNTELNKEQRININFALGNAYELLKEYSESAKFYRDANSEQQSRLNYDYDKEKYIVNSIIEVYTKKKINQIRIVKEKNRQIFILGMPRSGTSLVEQILSSHLEVYGGGELSFIEDYLLKNRGSIGLRMPDILINPNQEKILNFHNYYNEKTEYLNQDKLFITDKMPGNFKWIGLIKSAFPESKIIHVIRDKKDTCFSIYKSYFANDACAYAYHPSNIVGFYNLYQDVMEHWKSIFQKDIYECKYEVLVNNFENESKNILDYCNLTWDKNVLRYFENKRRVFTVSSAQVREKIYKSSINSWINYKDDLGNFFKTLK
ncbi:MAG: sulfotransferase [Candidatus Puniceispirillales bacterium]